MYRTLIESTHYKEQIARLGGAERLDDVLMAATWALCENPEIYEPVKGFQDIRLLKTDAVGGVPAFRIWFRLAANGQQVHLEYIESVEADS